MSKRLFIVFHLSSQKGKNSEKILIRRINQDFLFAIEKYFRQNRQNLPTSINRRVFMETLTNMTFKDLAQLVNAIAEKFFRTRQTNADYIRQNPLSDIDENAYLLKVQKAYNSLSENEKNLINNEFFYQSYTWWWKALYSKATFYRYKREAMRKFLEAFYNE